MISKIDDIIKNLSEKINIDLGKDENYPFINLKSKIKYDEEKDEKFKEKISNNFIQKRKS